MCSRPNLTLLQTPIHWCYLVMNECSCNWYHPISLPISHLYVIPQGYTALLWVLKPLLRTVHWWYHEMHCCSCTACLQINPVTHSPEWDGLRSSCEPVNLAFTDSIFSLHFAVTRHTATNKRTQVNIMVHSTRLTLKVLNFWKLTSYCSLKPLWSGMGEVVPARTSPTLHPPTVHQLP